MQVPQSHLLVLDELGVLPPAELALHVLCDILFEQVLNIVVAELGLDDQAAVTDGAGAAAQVLQEEVHNVFGVPV